MTQPGLKIEEARYAVKEGIRCVLPEAQVVEKPLANGGEGTAAVLAEGLSESMIETEVGGPYGERIHSAIIQENKRNPMNASTYGGGEMILDTLKKGCRNKEGRQAPYQAKGLERIASIDKKHVIRELEGCTFRVACDVNNPLCGKQGATYIYGPQKGVDEGMKDSL